MPSLTLYHTKSIQAFYKKCLYWMNRSDLLQSHPTNQQQIYEQYKYLQLSDKKVYIKDKSRPDVYKMQQHCHCKHKDVSSLSI